MAENEIPEQILAVIACPTCKGDLEYNKEENKLNCKKCPDSYDIEDGIPNLMPKK